MYAMICFLFGPTVDTKKPGTQTTRSFQYTFPNQENFSSNRPAVYYFICPITTLTAYFSGITINM
jgi:hypothetical protein